MNDAKPAGAPGQAARLGAVALVAGVLSGGSLLSDLLQARDGPLSNLPPQGKARAQSLAENVLRHLGRIDTILDQFLDKSPPDRVLNILRVAAAELLVDGIAPHAVVDGAVRMAKAGKKTGHLSGLVNAVARKVALEGPQIWADLEPQTLPDWLRAPMLAAFGAAATLDIEAAHERGAKLDLTLRESTQADHWAAALVQAGQEVTILPTGSLRLNKPGQISALPGYSEGAWWVQDAAAAIPARMLGDVRGLNVLDLCAAPGGKTMQLAAFGADVTALDVSKNRLKRLEDNLTRTKLGAKVIAADAVRWQAPEKYDAILLDAPCSASGTIRRHPDMPFVKDRTDLAELRKLQSILLDRALGWLKPGGKLIYCTCSLLPEEGEAQVGAHALTPVDAGDFGLRPEWVTNNQLRLRPDYWPDLGGMDGFFAAIVSP